MLSSKTTGAVITADIVNSTLLTGGREKKFAHSLHILLKPYKTEFYRGDSFQVFIKDPSDAFRALLQIRVAARKISPIHDIRAGLGIGRVNLPIKKVSTATGEAFVLSGRSFDQLGKTNSRLIIQSANSTANLGLKVIAHFTDYLFGNLTEKQAEVLSELLNDSTQQESAKKLKKSQATINKHAQSAGWHEIVKLLTEYKELILIL